MASCKECVYWGEDNDAPMWRGLRRCMKAIMMENGWDWKHTDQGTENVELDPTLMMYVEDGSSYYAALFTKPNFYCAHFEKAE